MSTAPHLSPPTASPPEGSGHASEQKFRMLVESVKDYAIFMLDETGHVQTWNIGAQVTEGYTAAEICEGHGGTIHVEAAQPRGARFVVNLPQWSRAAPGAVFNRPQGAVSV